MLIALVVWAASAFTLAACVWWHLHRTGFGPERSAQAAVYTLAGWVPWLAGFGWLALGWAWPNGVALILAKVIVAGMLFVAWPAFVMSEGSRW